MTHLIFLILIFNLNAFAQETVEISRFATDGIKTWENKSFKGETKYEIREQKLWAQAQGTASGLFKKQKVDISKTPFLNWSWKVEKLLTGNDEKIKTGDDFPARIYIVVSGGMAFWKTRAINFVWSNKYSTGEHWPNPFTKNAIMYAVESGPKNLGKFVSYKINVQEVLKKTLAKDYAEIDAVAVMTDSDQTGADVSATYGEIFFTKN